MENTDGHFLNGFDYCRFLKTFTAYPRTKFKVSLKDTGNQRQEKAPEHYLLVVSGATASGKTGFSIELAQHFQTEIISCDSRQFYREMSIGTAKPSLEELAAIPHHFVGHISIHTPYTVGDFEADAISRLDQLFQKHRHVVLCGGSGLFVKAVCEGLDQFPAVPASINTELQKALDSKGMAFLQEELRVADPVYYQEVDLQNPRRLLRAISVIRASGKPFSEFRNQQPKVRNFYPIYLQMDWPREQLYRRIDQRVEIMMEQGLLQEARTLYPHRGLQSLQTVGYQELFDYFDGLISLEEAVTLIKRNSRRYAKRQLTWFRRDGFWEAFHPDAFSRALTYIGRQIED